MTTFAPKDWRQAADTLAGILQAENAVLRKGDFAAAAALLAAKRDAIEAIGISKPSGPKQALGETLRRLDALAAENRDLLSRSISVQTQLLGIIAGAARAAASFGYGRSGKSAMRGGAFTLSARA